MLRILCGLCRGVVKIARSVHENCFSFYTLKRFDGVPVKSRRRSDIMAIISPCLPNPVVGVEPALKPIILKTLDPVHDIKPLWILGLQAIGSSRRKREKHIHPRAPALFRLFGVVTIIVI